MTKFKLTVHSPSYLTPKVLGNYQQNFTKIIHIADVHVPLHLNIDRMEEYQTVFTRLYQMIKIIASNEQIIIVIAGDLLHVKGVIEAETVIVARTFLETLSKIAPTIVILGNHDFMINNIQRTDMITALSQSIDNMYFLKYTGVYRLGNVMFSFSSLIDNKFIKYNDIKNSEHLPIYKLFHGTINGSMNYNGTINRSTNSSTYHSINDFVGYDGVLLGHIHKYQKLLPTVCYSGSLLVQNFGESSDNHGFIVWDINQKTNNFVEVPNDYVFVNLHIDNGKLSSNSTKLLESYKDKHKYIRIKCHLENTTNNQYQQLTDELKTQYNITEICTSHPIEINTLPTQQITDTYDNAETELIRQITKPDLYNDVSTLHNQLKHNMKEQTESVTWTIIKLRFRNIMIYGNDYVNQIDFISGIHNICSPNMTGKSSIGNIIMYALFDRIGNNMTSRSNILHNGSSDGFIELTFIHNHQLYMIEKCTNNKGTFNTNFYKINNDTNVSLNGKDSRDTVRIISNYVGDFERFISHNIISTKIGNSIIQMTPSERLKHFHKICGTDIYDNCVKLVSERNKNSTIVLNQYNEQLHQLTKAIENINIDQQITNMKDCQLEHEKILKLTSELHNKIQNISCEKGRIETELDVLCKQYDDNIGDKQPTISKQDINQRLSSLSSYIENNHELSTKTTGQSSVSLLKLIKLYQSFIKNVTDDCNENLLSEQLKSIDDKIQLHLNSKPQHDHDHLIKQLTLICKEIDDINHQMIDAQQRIDELNNCGVLQPINKNDTIQSLQQEKQQLEKQIYSLQTQFQSSTQSVEEIRKFIESVPNSDINSEQTDNKLVILKNELSKLDKQFKSMNNIDTLHPIDDTTTIQSLESAIEFPIHINKKKIVDLTEFDMMNKKLVDISNICPTTNYQEIYDIIDQLQYCNDISSQSKKIRKFIECIENGIFNEKIKLVTKIEKYESDIKYNQQIDDDIQHNHQINDNNTKIKHQINWINKHSIETQIKNLKEEIKSLTLQHKKYQMINQLDLYKLIDNEKQINKQITFIEINQYKQLIEQLQNQLESVKAHKKELNQQIEWYTTNEQLITKQQNINNIKSVLDNNRKYNQLIDETNILLKYVSKCEEKEQLETIMKQWILFENNQQLSEKIAVTKQQLHDILRTLSENNENIKQFQINDAKITNEITNLKILIDNYNNNVVKISELDLKIKQTDNQIKIYNEYERVFNRNMLPLKILQNKLTMFNEQVNRIFEKYTKYQFSYEQDENGKLSFIVKQRDNDCILEPERLSGFETICLLLSIDQAMLSISSRYKCGLLIIDESLDCLDQVRFVEQLPNIIDIMRQFYQTIIMISHRDIPPNMVDKQLKINPYGTYSTIDQ